VAALVSVIRDLAAFGLQHAVAAPGPVAWHEAAVFVLEAQCELADGRHQRVVVVPGTEV
jgi:hypothetical protein